MNRILTWREVSQFLSSKAKRYSRYLKSVLSTRFALPGPLPPEQVSEENRRRVLDAIFRWVVRNHARQRPVSEIDIRAVAWLLRFVCPCHPVFDELETHRLSREQIYDGLGWVVDAVQFDLMPDADNGVVLVGRDDTLTYYFDPLQMIAPNFSHSARVPFSQKMAARRIAEYMFRAACTVKDDATVDDVNDLAIRAAANRLLEVVAPLADENDD